VVANRAGSEAWVSLWNGSAVDELDVKKGKIARRIELWRPSDPVQPGSHPTAMTLNRAEDTLYVAISNAATANADGASGWNHDSVGSGGIYCKALCPGGSASP